MKATEPVLPPIPVTVADVCPRRSSARSETLRRIRVHTGYRRIRSLIHWCVSLTITGEMAGACYLAATNRISLWVVTFAGACLVSVSFAAADFATTMVDLADFRLGELSDGTPGGSGSEKQPTPRFCVLTDGRD